MPVKSWLQQIQAQDFFNLESEEISEEGEISMEPDPVIEHGTPESSGYEPSIGEPEREVTGDGQSNVPGDLGGLGVPVPDDEGDLLFGDTVEFWHPDPTKMWEIDITPPSCDPSWSWENPEEIVCVATEVRKKRVEVSLKDLGEADQLRFAAAKDKEIRAWLHHRTVHRKSPRVEFPNMLSCDADGCSHGKGLVGMNHLGSWHLMGRRLRPGWLSLDMKIRICPPLRMIVLRSPRMGDKRSCNE